MSVKCELFYTKIYVKRPRLGKICPWGGGGGGAPTPSVVCNKNLITGSCCTSEGTLITPMRSDGEDIIAHLT